MAISNAIDRSTRRSERWRSALLFPRKSRRSRLNLIRTRASHRKGILLAERRRRRRRPQRARLYSTLRCSFIVPLQSSHSLIRYGESVLTERALITTLDRSSDPLRVRTPVPISARVCVYVCVYVCGCDTSYDILVKSRSTSKQAARRQGGSNTENANR